MGRAFEYRRASKEKRWATMSKIFPKLAKAITVAAKEGGGDPEMNAKLRSAILAAKAQNMPKDNIDAAVNRALGKDAQIIHEVNYEGKGPHGVLIFVETATDNPTRTVANIKSYFSKSGGQVVPTGSLEFLFARKAYFEFPLSHNYDLEELELTLIDAGLDELEVDEENNLVTVYGDYTNFGTLSTALSDCKIDVTKSGLKRIPTSPVEFNESQLVDIEKLLDKIEEDDDVQEVFTNIL